MTSGESSFDISFPELFDLSPENGEVTSRMLRLVLDAVSEHMPLDLIQLEVPESDLISFTDHVSEAHEQAGQRRKKLKTIRERNLRANLPPHFPRSRRRAQRRGESDSETSSTESDYDESSPLVDEVIQRIDLIEESIGNLCEFTYNLVHECDEDSNQIMAAEAQVEALKMRKADKEEVIEALAEKVDRELLEDKISHDEFFGVYSGLSRTMQEILDELSRQEKELEESLAEASNYTDVILGNYADNLFSTLDERLNAAIKLKKKLEAASTRVPESCIELDMEDEIPRNPQHGVMLFPLSKEDMLRQLQEIEARSDPKRNLIEVYPEGTRFLPFTSIVDTDYDSRVKLSLADLHPETLLSPTPARVRASVSLTVESPPTSPQTYPRSPKSMGSPHTHGSPLKQKTSTPTRFLHHKGSIEMHADPPKQKGSIPTRIPKRIGSAKIHPDTPRRKGPAQRRIPKQMGSGEILEATLKQKGSTPSRLPKQKTSRTQTQIGKHHPSHTQTRLSRRAQTPDPAPKGKRPPATI
ncbi:uncharacterized protein LOC110835560 [Zootermopsis nevadensis]|uniref:DUF4795 domain-containing protein n=1 Tax=Zootermopsis nevadensis TaxID=136037 RepID=A0A067R2K9_ZOONE|nr:uncharacterized protein LOC110835560 [Zootermopsis nevadensis]XP_021931579.1 uncharacterized protein LOC110835560 [Zootermopsis nevadensis]KDR13230.1 hypothetical protein L798_12850 [Zootermopsis nevadensis]